MTKMKVKYLGGLRTEAQHLKSGNKFITDAPTDNMGKGEAFSPTDTVSAALASCMITIMGIVSNREGWNIDGIETEIEKIMLAEPRKIGEIIIKFKLPEGMKFSEKQALVLKRAALTCPVALSLNPDIKQTVEFNF